MIRVTVWNEFAHEKTDEKVFNACEEAIEEIYRLIKDLHTTFSGVDLFVTPRNINLKDGYNTEYIGRIDTKFIRYIDRNGNNLITDIYCVSQLSVMIPYGYFIATFFNFSNIVKSKVM